MQAAVAHWIISDESKQAAEIHNTELKAIYMLQAYISQSFYVLFIVLNIMLTPLVETRSNESH